MLRFQPRPKHVWLSALIATLTMAVSVVVLSAFRAVELSPFTLIGESPALMGAIVCLPMVVALLWTSGRLRKKRDQAGEEGGATASDATLRETLERTRLILDGTLDAVVGMDMQGSITDWNAMAEAIFGWTREEAIGRKLVETIIPPQYRDAHNLGFRRFLSSGEGPFLNRRIEMTALRRDGTEFPVELTINSLKTGESHVFSAFITDVTERKWNEQALRESEERYRGVVEDQTEVISRIREDGTFTFVNDVFCRFFGKTAHELIGTHWQPVVHPEDLPHIEAQLSTLSPSNHVLMIENRVYAGDGRLCWMQFVNRGFFNPDGRLVEIQSVGRDITERKLTQEALVASEKRLRTILEAEPECVKVTTEDGVLLDINAAGLTMIEAASLDQVRGRSVLPNIAPDYRDAFAEVIRRAYRGDPGTLQFVIIGLKGKRRWLEIHAVPLRDEHNATIGVLGISRDITERKRAEDALRSSERVLRTLLKEREQLVQDLHDGIIQSLYAIGMSIEECRRLVEEDPEEAKLKLEQEIADVNAVIRAVRSHLAQGENDVPLSASRFKAELTRVAGTMERANALHFRLKVDQRAAECLTTEERRELLYIAQEAMSNCLRHSNASVANVSLRLGRDRVCLEVEDNGTGFDKQTLHETNGGLRNIERRAAKVGAKMEIVSYREHGTRLRLDVPIHTSPGVST